MLAKPRGEEILENEDAQHVGALVRKHVEGIVGQIEVVDDGFEVRRVDLELQRLPFAACGPLDEVLRRLVDAGNTHGGIA